VRQINLFSKNSKSPYIANNIIVREGGFSFRKLRPLAGTGLTEMARKEEKGKPNGQWSDS
jgi:hypothetical protein